MGETKGKSMELKGMIRIRGVGPYVLPFIYQGKMLRATAEKPQEVLWEQLPYDSKIHIGRARDSGHIEIERED